MDALLRPRSPHALAIDEVVESLRTDESDGLALEEAQRRHELLGGNALPAAKVRSRWRILIDQFRSPLIYVLLAAALATIAIGHVVDAIVIAGVVAVNAAVGMVQESRAGEALAALEELTSGDATVVRDGQPRRIPAEALVLGDLVSLDAGDRVPADLRLLDCHQARVDESSLTGESVPVHKSTHAIAGQTPLADRTCMAFAGTLVTSGRARGVVIATGRHTQVGVIQSLMKSADDIQTPLTRKLAHFSRVITVVILGLAVATFVMGLWRGESVGYMVTAAVALAVGAIPEGLPAVVTITLAIGLSRMAARRAVIRRLPAVETLGSVTVICTDKTGTLTEGRMTVQSVFCDGRWWPIGPGMVRASVRDCLLAGVLCNDASLESDDGATSGGVGDPVEIALLAAARRAAPEVVTRAAHLTRTQEIPFASELRLMATLHVGDDAGTAVLAVKGATEEVAGLCHMGPGEEATINEALEGAGDQALRVLALASAEVPLDFELGIDSLRATPLNFLGLVALQDPPRSDAVTAVAACHRAGIDVQMITGDHLRTATAIAEQVGIPPSRVIARVTADQKLDVVRRLQGEGEVVAMTGDGVNDAPALRQADIGVAMGRGGTEVAKESADMVILDDDFATIESAVEEGRTVFDNLVKYISWTLPTNFAEGLVVLVSVGLGATLPILPLQILWINTLTAVALGVMLAFEPSEPDVMARPPRAAQRPLLSRPLVVRAAVVGVAMLGGVFGAFLAARSWGMDLDTSRTVAVNGLVAMEIAYLLVCRSGSGSITRARLGANRWIWVGVAITIVLQLVLTYVPVMNSVFGTAPLGIQGWLLVVVPGVALLVVGIMTARGTQPEVCT